MNGALHDGGMTVIEIEPDPQAGAFARKLMEAFADMARAPAAAADPLRDRTIITTMNSTASDIGFLPGAVAERFKPIEIPPMSDELIGQIADRQIAEELEKQNLSERQRKAAEKFLKEQAGMEDTSSGVRDVIKRIRQSFGSASFKDLMRENSGEWTFGEMSQAIKAGAKGKVHAPATARFKRRHTP